MAFTYTYPPLVTTLDTDDADAVGVRQFADFLEEHGAEFDANSAETFVQGRQGYTNSIWRYHAHPEELYKYTDIKSALTPEYGINLRRRLFVEDPGDHYRLGIAGLNAHTVFVVNDVVVNTNAPRKPGDKSQYYIGSIADVCESFRKGESFMKLMMEKYLFRSGAFRDDDPLTWLNSMLGQDGIFIYIPDNGKFPIPIQIINVSDSQTPMMSNRRIVVLMGHHAEADIVIFKTLHPDFQSKSRIPAVDLIRSRFNGSCEILSLQYRNHQCGTNYPREYTLDKQGLKLLIFNKKPDNDSQR